jgi:hypothetical protein
VLARDAARRFSPAELWPCTLVTTVEPCAMCAGTQYWANIGRTIFGIEEKVLLADHRQPRREPDPRPAVPARLRARPEGHPRDRPRRRGRGADRRPATGATGDRDSEIAPMPAFARRWTMPAHGRRRRRRFRGVLHGHLRPRSARRHGRADRPGHRLADRAARARPASLPARRRRRLGQPVGALPSPKVIVIDDKKPTAVIDAPRTVSFGASFSLAGNRSFDLAPGRIVEYRWVMLG